MYAYIHYRLISIICYNESATAYYIVLLFNGLFRFCEVYQLTSSATAPAPAPARIDFL